MAVVEGFWVAGLEGSEARMNACLTLIGTAAEITALNAATYKRCFAYATDIYRFYYSNGSTWVMMGIGVHTHQSDGQGGHLVDGVDVSALKSQADDNTAALVAAISAAPARSLNTIYQNTSGKLLLVTVSLHGTSTSTVTVRCDAAATPTTVVAYVGTLASGMEASIPVSFIVPVNYYYRVLINAGSPSIYNWNEWTLH